MLSESSAALDPFSRMLLDAAIRLPRGSARVINAWARLDPRLRDHPAPLRDWPERCLRLDLRDAESLQLLIHGYYPYQAAEDELCARVLRRGDVVYDVGANVGYMTLMFLHRVGASGQVHAFEPSRRCFDSLQRSLEPGDPVQLTQKAVGREAGEVVFEEHAALNLSSVAGFGTPQSSTRQPARRYTVQTITLDEYWKGQQATPCLVKIDVEGFESQVFEGMRELLTQHAPILMFEAASSEELERNLAALGSAAPNVYQCARIAHDKTLVALDRTEGVTCNFFAVPEWAHERFDGIPLPPT